LNRWIRFLILFIMSQFRKRINWDEESSLNFRVWITDADLSLMNNSVMIMMTELGRIDLILRTGFLKYAKRNGLYLPLASISVQFIRPLKRFQNFQLITQLIYWDNKWIYFSHRITSKGKTIAVALAKTTVKKGKERIPFETIINELNWEMKKQKCPEMIYEFEKGEHLFLKNLDA